MSGDDLRERVAEVLEGEHVYAIRSHDGSRVISHSPFTLTAAKADALADALLPLIHECEEKARAEGIATYVARQQEWSLRTFGPGARLSGLLDHLRKELSEVEAAPDDVTEWVDVVILALDGAWRSGHTPEAVAAALEAKQCENFARQWPDWRSAPAGRAIEHVRAALDGGDQS